MTPASKRSKQMTSKHQIFRREPSEKNGLRFVVYTVCGYHGWSKLSEARALELVARGTHEIIQAAG
jgi:hypothetical protein